MLFNQIRKNERRTKWLLCIFFILIVLFGNFVGGLWNIWLTMRSRTTSTSTISVLIRQSITWQDVLITTAISMAIVGLYMYVVLHRSMHIIMSMNHAQEVTLKLEYPVLWNAVNNMAIASGLPMPRIFVINDSSPNAFSTGISPKNSAIGVTTGLLSSMNAYEIEGVIGHEMSHIKDHDTRIETVGIALTAIFAFIGGWLFSCFDRLDDNSNSTYDDDSYNDYDDGFDDADDDNYGEYNDGTNLDDSDSTHMGLDTNGSDFLGSSSSSSSNDNSLGILALFGLAIIVVSWICCGISYLTQMALSRNREYLADAGSVDLTRNPKELIDALKSLKNRPSMTQANPSSNALYIVNPHKPKHRWSIANLFDTHPPLDKRIQRLEQMEYAPK